jgi:hypothetical protein
MIAWSARCFYDSLLALGAIALVFADEAAAQSFNPNIVSRIESFISPSPETVLPTKTKKVPVKKTGTTTVTVEEKKELTTEEREAKAREMGIVVPLGLRSTTARKAYLNLRNVPTYRIVRRQKKTTRTITEIVEKKEPRRTVIRGYASAGYSYATNANQVPVGIVPDSIGNENANLLILIPAGREEDTLSILLGRRRCATRRSLGAHSTRQMPALPIRGCLDGSRRLKDWPPAAQRARIC